MSDQHIDNDHLPLTPLDTIMSERHFNKDKLHAVICIAASAVVSITIIVLIIKTLL